MLFKKSVKIKREEVYNFFEGQRLHHRDFGRELGRLFYISKC